EIGEKVSPTQFQNGWIESGEKNISLETLEKLSFALGSMPGDLLDVPVRMQQNEKDKFIESISNSLQKRSTQEVKALHKLIGDLIKMLDLDLK
ncbi:hypothetical protein AMQ83_12210, partial [Paenibacillus riograndensis]